MNDTVNDGNLTTADIANPQRPIQLPANGGDHPDLYPVQSTQTGQGANAEAKNNDSPANFANAGSGGATPKVNNANANNMNNANANNANNPAPLFAEDELRDFRGRWDGAQSSFVDEPRQAVEQADNLVANVVKRIAEQFAAERANLEKQWDSGENVSTEDLRQALKRYRSLFDRLLTF
jgi:hypothetical protein